MRFSVASTQGTINLPFYKLRDSFHVLLQKRAGLIVSILILYSQVLYMDAIEYFPDELQEILDLMVEKELRVRLPIEELELLLED